MALQIATWVFFALGVFSACMTYNVYRPRLRGPQSQVYSFFLGWLWGELALHVIVVQALGTALFCYLGVLGSTAGVIGLLLTAASCGALAFHYLESVGALEAAEAGLRDGLGEHYEEQVPADLRAGFEKHVRWRALARPFKMRHPDVEVVRNIRFSREKGTDLELDLYRHRSHPSDCPTLLQIHGGGWVIGDKREQALPLMHQMAARGWVCISCNYRLSPHATFPEHLIDVKKAIAWIRAEGPKYGINTDFLVVTGGSAGGHLAALTGLTANDPEYQPGFEQVATDVDAAVPVYGVYDFRDRFGLWRNKGLHQLLERSVIKSSITEEPDAYRRASPMDRVHAERPPFLVVHGDCDSLVPVEEARAFVGLLRENGDEPVAYIEVPGAQHAFEIFRSVRSQVIVDAVERFCSFVYARYLDRREQAAGEELGSGPREVFDDSSATAPPADESVPDGR